MIKIVHYLQFFYFDFFKIIYSYQSLIGSFIGVLGVFLVTKLQTKKMQEQLDYEKSKYKYLNFANKTIIKNELQPFTVISFLEGIEDYPPEYFERRKEFKVIADKIIKFYKDYDVLKYNNDIILAQIYIYLNEYSNNILEYQNSYFEDKYDENDYKLGDLLNNIDNNYDKIIDLLEELNEITI